MNTMQTMKSIPSFATVAAVTLAMAAGGTWLNAQVAPPVPGYIAGFDGSQTRPHSIDGVEWVDQSGNGNDAISGSGGAHRRPTLLPNAINGMNALHFDKAARQFLVIDGASSTGLDSEAYTWFGVIRLSDSAGFQTLIRHRSTFNGINWGTYFWEGNQDWTDGEPAVVANGRTAAGTGIEARAHPWTPGHWLLVSGLVDGPSGDVYSRVEDLETGAVAEALVNAGEPLAFGDPVYLWIGARHSGADWLDGEIAELLLYNTALSPTDEALVEDYLRVKYVPEPGIVSLAALGLLALLAPRRRRS